MIALLLRGVCLNVCATVCTASPTARETRVRDSETAGGVKVVNFDPGRPCTCAPLCKRVVVVDRGAVCFPEVGQASMSICTGVTRYPAWRNKRKHRVTLQLFLMLISYRILYPECSFILDP